MIKMLICVKSFFRLTTITSVFLLFTSILFSLFFSSSTPNNCCSLLYFLQLLQYHQRISSCLHCALLLGYPSGFRKNNFTVEREKIWGKPTSLSDTTLYFFLNELISPSACIAAICSQCMFLISFVAPFPSTKFIYYFWFDFVSDSHHDDS